MISDDKNIASDDVIEDGDGGMIKSNLTDWVRYFKWALQGMN